MVSRLALPLMLVLAGGGDLCEELGSVAEQVRAEWIAGDRQTAEKRLRMALDCDGIAPETEVTLRLELATLLDRQGLHSNTRPVEEALAQIEAASALLDRIEEGLRGRLELAWAWYYYRAEMRGREFARASFHAERARRFLESAADAGRLVYAVHLEGLIAQQKGELEPARELFDRSLELARATEPTSLFLADYHRHVGFVDYLSGDLDTALRHFRKSYELRRKAGARDHALFAAVTWASTLVEAGRPEEAGDLVREALAAAAALRSPVGRLRALGVKGKMEEALGLREAARATYAAVLEAARALGSASYEQAALEASERLRDAETASTPEE